MIAIAVPGHRIVEAGKFGDVPRSNGVWLILAGFVFMVMFWVFARPALREHRALKGGAPMGRLVVAGPVGVVFVVLGVVLLFVGH